MGGPNLGLEAKNLPKCGFKPIKFDIKLKLRKIAKKTRNLRPGPWLPEADPLRAEPLHGGVLTTFYRKISTPCRREANFRVLA